LGERRIMTKKRVGFAAMDKEKHRKIARLGGIAAHKKGVAHEFTPEEARAAGRKGGKIGRRGKSFNT
jgi:general stress protein YciG